MNSKRLILLFSICFLVSGYFLAQQWTLRVGLIDEERNAKDELATETRLRDAVKAAVEAHRVAGESDVRKIDEELVSLVIAAKGALPGRMITVSSFAVTRSTTAQQGTPLAMIAAPLARSAGLKLLNLKLAGSYQNLRLLQEYIAELKTHPIVLSGLTIDKNLFTMQIQLIGK